MIKYIHKAGWKTNEWLTWPKNEHILPPHFHFYYFKINEILYKEQTLEFDKEYEKEWMWEKLND